MQLHYLELAEASLLCLLAVLVMSVYHDYQYAVDFQHHHTLAQFVDFLAGWSVGVGLFRAHVLDLCGSLLACRTYRIAVKGKKHWVESILSCAIMQYGGTTITGLVLGQPPSWMLGTPPVSTISLLLAWWLVFCCPYDLFFHVMKNPVVPLWSIVELLSAVSCGLAVTTWGIDKVLFNSFHPGGIIGKSCLLWILCGVTSSSGGGLLCRALNLLGENSYTMDRNNRSLLFSLTGEGETIRIKLSRNFYASCAYICMINPGGLLPWNENLNGDQNDAKAMGHLVVCSFYVLYFLLNWLSPEYSSDAKFSFLTALNSILMNLFCIPKVICGGNDNSLSSSNNEQSILNGGSNTPINCISDKLDTKKRKRRRPKKVKKS